MDTSISTPPDGRIFSEAMTTAPATPFPPARLRGRRSRHRASDFQHLASRFQLRMSPVRFLDL